MASVFGNRLKISLFGQSHSEAIGVVIDGLPAGFAPDMEKIAAFMARRSPIGKEGVTSRREPDEVEVVSGLFDGKTCGAPLCAMIRNVDARPQDYESMRGIPRPSHADFPAMVKYGGNGDYRGGGHFSGRLTAPLCFAGAVAVQMLEERGVTVGARVKSVGNAYDSYVDPAEVTADMLRGIAAKDFPTVGSPDAIKKEISDAEAAGDSVGGQVECFITGLPVGVGEPIFDGLESRISAAVFAIPAVKGIEFGDGFALTGLRASEANDEYYIAEDGKIRTKTNSNGGILGGLSTGMPVAFSAAFKPTPSISRPQTTVDMAKMTDSVISIPGRHDPCIVVRAVPCVESAAALAVLDLML